MSDTETVLVLYWHEWLAGSADAPLTPEVAAGNCLALWGSARKALVARARLCDRWSRRVNELLTEAAKEEEP